MKAILILATALLISSTQPVIACGYDGQINNPFTQAYPGSLSVALATRTAVEKSVINPVSPLSGQAGFDRSVRWLQQLRERLQQNGFSGSVSVLLIDSGLWSQYSDQGTQIAAATDLLQSIETLKLQIHAQAPSANEAVLITSEATLAALLSGEIKFENATLAGLVRMNQPLMLNLSQ
nr:hypothetical protein [uncultured Deefgea sp.]